MKAIRSFTLTLVVFLAIMLVVGQSMPAQAQSDAGQAQPGATAAPVRAIVTDGQTGEVIPDSKLTFTTIDVPGAGLTSVNGINTAGDLVGDYSPSESSGVARSFVYSSGVFSYFGYPGYTFTVASGINDSDLVVGEASSPPEAVGFLYNGTTFTTLRDGSNSATYAEGLNNSGVVVGGSGTIYITKAFELRDGRYTTINFPGTYTYGFGFGINNRGQVVGSTVDGTYQYGYLYQNGEFQNVDFPGAMITDAYGINDSGLIVGWYNLGTASDYAFTLKNDKYISFSYPGALQTFAAGVNASGQVVGQYTFDQKTYHGFVTNPIGAADFGEVGQ